MQKCLGFLARDEGGVGAFLEHPFASWPALGASILAPAGTPKPIVDKLSLEVAKYLAQPAFREKMIGQGQDPFFSSPEQYAAQLKESLATNLKIITAANIKFEN
jgi:tripartite-type tricarboxylate transporter receptor subunit TctC